MGRKEWYRSISKGDKEIPGCMSGMLHLFDFHSILFAPTNSRAVHISSPQLQHCHSQLKGVEAPRNSLELDEAAAVTTTSNASALAEEYYGIPIGMQVKAPSSLTKKKKKKKDLAYLVEEEKRNSQCETPRTPNVVARLMGLDILPDGDSTPTLGVNKSQIHSPKISAIKKKIVNAKQYFDASGNSTNRKPLQKRDINVLGSRSLPDTPRVSSERSRDGDERLSLQTNKENVNVNRATYLYDVQSLPPSPTYITKPRRSKDGFKSNQDENKSPRSNYYAKEIVKQARENINRRSNRGDENVICKSRRTRVVDDKRVLVENNERKDLMAKPNRPPLNNYFLEPPKPHRPQSTSIPYYRVGENVEAKQLKTCKKACCEKFTERIKKQQPPTEIATQSESFMNRLVMPKPSLPSSISSNLLASSDKNNNSSTFEKIKSSYSVTTTTSSTRRDASNQSPSPAARRTRVVCFNPAQEEQYQRSTKEEDSEFLYIKSILEYAGIMKTDTAQLRWYSPSIPVDPFVFHQLELDHMHSPAQMRVGTLQHKCNRKLLFHLVEEILADLPSFSSNTHKKRLHDINKDLLLDSVWSKINSFPLSDCQVIEDIDALVAEDLTEANIRQLLCHQLVVAEAEDIASEIEENVIDSIVGEAVASIALCSKF